MAGRDLNEESWNYRNRPTPIITVESRVRMVIKVNKNQDQWEGREWLAVLVI